MMLCMIDRGPISSQPRCGEIDAPWRDRLKGYFPALRKESGMTQPAPEDQAREHAAQERDRAAQARERATGQRARANEERARASQERERSAEVRATADQARERATQQRERGAR